MRPCSARRVLSSRLPYATSWMSGWRKTSVCSRPSGGDELRALEVAQGGIGPGLRRTPSRATTIALRELHAHDRCQLKGASRLRRQRIQPRQEHLVDRRRQPMRLAVSPAPLAVQQLLEEQRVAGATARARARSARSTPRRPAASSCAMRARVLRPQRAKVELLVGAAALPAVRPVRPIRRQQHDAAAPAGCRAAPRRPPGSPDRPSAGRRARRSIGSRCDAGPQQAADRVHQDPLPPRRREVGQLRIVLGALAEDLVEDRGPSARASPRRPSTPAAAQGVRGALARLPVEQLRRRAGSTR